MQSYGTVRTTGARVDGVGYYTACFACNFVDFRGTVLRSALRSAGVPFTHGGYPGQSLP